MSRNHYLLQEFGALLGNSAPEPQPQGRILIVDEDGAAYRAALSATLVDCRLILETTPAAANRVFLVAPLDLVLLGHSQQHGGLDLLSLFKAQRPTVPVILVTDCGSEELAVAAFRRGAIDYFNKPLDAAAVALSIRAVLAIRRRHQKQDVLPANGLHRALRYLDTHFQEPIRLIDAARAAGMSVSCFERCLKNQTGLSFIAYLNSLRIARARELLLKTSTSMLRIALACGFGNQSHFNRVFRKFVGVTPRTYRKAATVS